MTTKLKIIPIVMIFFALLVYCVALISKPKILKEERPKLPNVMLWSWERADNLKFINPKTIGVAFLVKTLSLKGDEVKVIPRFQPLEIVPEAQLIGVVRIETDRYQLPTFSTKQLEKTLFAIAELTKLERIVGIQIDFDAKVSEREFYRQLLTKLRSNIPSKYLLSITALASWATYDVWGKDLPVDEVVPMFFRMGSDKQQIINYLAAKKDFKLQNAISCGISTDSELPWLPSKKRVYIFPESSWSAELLNNTLKKVEKWQTK